MRLPNETHDIRDQNEFQNKQRSHDRRIKKLRTFGNF